jgi:hypothetical protein
MMKNKFIWPFVVLSLVACTQTFSTYKTRFDTDAVTNVDSDHTVQVSMRIYGNGASSQMPATVEISIVNLTNERIMWGRGSSSCRLGLRVIDGPNEHSAFIDRMCTMDEGPYYLDPGESYTNSITWNGEVIDRKNRSRRSLSPGTYELIGVAGKYRSDPIGITVW